QSLGANLLIISSAQPTSETRTRIEPLTSADVTALSSPATAPSLSMAGGQYSVVTFISAEGQNLRTSVRGVTPNMSEILSWDVALGEFISADHVNRNARVAVLGREAVEELYGIPEADPIGATIRLNE